VTAVLGFVRHAAGFDAPVGHLAEPTDLEVICREKDHDTLLERGRLELPTTLSSVMGLP
jgi:hypothetical protein